MKAKFKDPGSAITHLIAMILSFFTSIPLVFQATRSGMPVKSVSMSIFGLSMVLLYAASTIYHTFDISEKINRLLRKMDHAMIFILIAGSYTPVCLVGLRNHIGLVMLAVVWGIAIFGIVLKLLWINCPKWFSSCLYITMGWVCIIGLPQMMAVLPHSTFLWLLAGGIIYTIGGIIYALKLSGFNNRFPNFGSHEVFHLFVMGGSICHFAAMFTLI